MKIADIQLSKCFPFFDAKLIEEIKEHADIKYFDSKEYVLKQGSYPKSLPIILKGLIKLYVEENGKEIFLHYLNPYRSLLTYFHLSHQKPMEYSVKTETPTLLLCLPKERVNKWFAEHPVFVNLLLYEFHTHYSELLEATKEMAFKKIEDRLKNYLINKAKIRESNTIVESHKRIALDLGTSREVISRITKKLHESNILIQHRRHIELLHI